MQAKSRVYKWCAYVQSARILQGESSTSNIQSPGISIKLQGAQYKITISEVAYTLFVETESEGVLFKNWLSYYTAMRNNTIIAKSLRESANYSHHKDII